MEKKKSSPIRQTDLLLACLADKQNGLSALTGKPTAPVVKRAFRWLEMNNCADHAEVLRGFARDHWGIEISVGRGRGVPEVGDEKLYRVQLAQDSAFIRLPMSTLSLTRGDVVKVSFEENQIMVSPVR